MNCSYILINRQASFQLSAYAGANRMDYEEQQLHSTGLNINTPGIRNISNFQTRTGNEFLNRKRINSCVRGSEYCLSAITAVPGYQRTERLVVYTFTIVQFLIFILLYLPAWYSLEWSQQHKVLSFWQAAVFCCANRYGRY